MLKEILEKKSLFWKNVLLDNDLIMNVINIGYIIRLILYLSLLF
jgi:hypothetical protein